MESYFRMTQSKLKSQSTAKFKKEVSPQKNIFKQEKLAIKSLNRATSWSRAKLYDKEVLKTLKEGAFPLVHPDHFEYRVRNRALDRQKNDVYVRTYKPSKQRAEDTCQGFRKTHLEPVPFTKQKHFLDKPRLVDKEMGHTFRFGERTESERLLSFLNGSMRLLDSSPKDNTMLADPKWKDVIKEKWISKKNFDTTSCFYRGRRSVDPWPVIPIGINIGDPYNEGFEVLGDLSRNRSREREISPINFCAVSPTKKDKGFEPIYNSSSIRNSKSSNFFGTGSSGDQKMYPKTLKQIISDRGGLNEIERTFSPIFSSSPKANHVQIGKLFSPLKETRFSRARTEMSPSPEIPERTSVKSKLSVVLKTGKIPKNINREEYIRKTVKVYFDE